MTKPVQAALSQEDIHTCNVGTFEDVVVCNIIRPLYAKDYSQFTHVEGVESVFIFGVQCL